MPSWGLHFCVVLSMAVSVQGQEMRIYTRIHRPTQVEKPAQGPVVARSLTLFHAGKVYDYLDSVQEVTIYEPHLRRITILDEQRQLATEISLEQVRHFLQLAEQQARERIESGVGTPSAQSPALRLLQFQLSPRFEPIVDSRTQAITLTGDAFRYDAQGFTPTNPEVIEAYLGYADVAAMLNSLLHPQTFLPGPRLELNRQLRAEKWLPQTVRLRVDMRPPLDLYVEHGWTWTLATKDRQQIHHWEQSLRSPTLRRQPFQEFQKDTLSGEATAKR